MIRKNALLSDQSDDFLCYVNIPKINDDQNLLIVECILSYKSKEKMYNLKRVLELEVVKDENLGEVN